MTHSVRANLLALGLGSVLQRLAQLAALLCIGRTLGLERMGVYAQGLAAGALLAVLAGAGVRNVVARAVVHEPANAGTLVRSAVRARLWFGVALAAPVAAGAFAWTERPLFWTLCALQVAPAAFDLRSLLDVAARTRAEVALETSASVLHVGAVVAWTAAGGGDVTVLAALHLGCRCVYATGAALALTALPRGGEALSPWALLRRSGSVSIGHLAHDVMLAGDVWLLARIAGAEAAGLYAVAVRIAAAASLPSAQVGRLLLPHFLKAPLVGNPALTTRMALRATLLATLPVAAGGAVVAEDLCCLFGGGFAVAGDALRLLLLAAMLQHLGWQCGHSAFAVARDRAYAAGLLLAAVTQAALLFLAGRHGASGGAFAAAGAQVLYLASGLLLVRGTRPLAGGVIWQPLFVAAATAAAAALPSLVLSGAWLLPVRLAAGAGAFALALWHVELRGRIHRVGDGLVAASGFRA